MVDRPILRFPDPTAAARRTGSPRGQPRQQGPGRQRQGQRFQATFDGMRAAFAADDPGLILRQDPAGIAPERALVFVTAGSVQNFATAAAAIGLEVFSETDLEGLEDFPDGFAPAGDAATLSRALYATMPTLDTFRSLLRLWGAHQDGEHAPHGAGPWWKAFDLLLELRPWGPQDRLGPDARRVIRDRLPAGDDENTTIEFEIWPTTNAARRTAWRAETEKRVVELGGRVLDASSIAADGFVYEAVLARLPAGVVRAMLDDPQQPGGLAMIEGVQFIMPQTVGQAAPTDLAGDAQGPELGNAFVADAPVRVALFDGTPVAAHAALNGGVNIEDYFDLVRLSPVERRYHATAMASLILRGDLDVDGNPLTDTRLVSVPLLIDSDSGSWTPNNRLFVDMVHTALVRLIGGDDPAEPDVFVVNFSIGIGDLRFAGRISALARLLDWWAAREGVLFVISAGNIGDRLIVHGLDSAAFENSSAHQRRQHVRAAIRAATFERTLLAPSEALNGLTVGAVSKDLNGDVPAQAAGIFALEDDADLLPQITSALGLGPHRSIKPDMLHVGGRQEIRTWPDGTGNTRVDPVDVSRRTGLIVAGPGGTQKSRGTSPAAALTTRAVLQSAQALTGQAGPFEGLELPRRDFALLTRALAINATRWHDGAYELLAEQLATLGRHRHVRAKEEVCRHFGYGVINPGLMQRSPERGVTLVGLGTIRKDQALIFRMPLPPSMAGERVPRSMHVTLTWFTPVNATRAQYRLAGLEAIAADPADEQSDSGWLLDLKSDGPDANMIRRGSVWSRRLIHRRQAVPGFEADAEIPICVQCRDTAGGGLSPDDDIRFAIAVTLEVETEVEYDILNEIEQRIKLTMVQAA